MGKPLTSAHNRRVAEGPQQPGGDNGGGVNPGVLCTPTGPASTGTVNDIVVIRSSTHVIPHQKTAPEQDLSVLRRSQLATTVVVDRFAALPDGLRVWVTLVSTLASPVHFEICQYESGSRPHLWTLLWRQD